MTNKRKFHALITDAQDHEFDWGFYAITVTDGVIGMRCADWTPDGGYDTFIAPGEWKFIDTVLPEDDDE